MSWSVIGNFIVHLEQSTAMESCRVGSCGRDIEEHECLELSERSNPSIIVDEGLREVGKRWGWDESSTWPSR